MLLTYPKLDHFEGAMMATEKTL